MQADLLFCSRDSTGEGATWLPGSGRFVWVDIDRGILHEYRPEVNQVKDHAFPDVITAVFPSVTDAHEVWIAMRNRLISYHLETNAVRDLMTIFPSSPEFRTNDGKRSPEGRIWIGVMHIKDYQGTGSLYCVEKDFSSRKVLSEQCIPNGIVWNQTGDKMYYADSGKGCIYSFDYDMQKGTIHSQQTVIRSPEKYGVPDGMTMDKEGFLRVAHWGGFGVYIWNPVTGVLEDIVKVPVPHVASCAFGGENRDTLYITTARSGLSKEELEKYPLSGNLFSTKIN